MFIKPDFDKYPDRWEFARLIYPNCVEDIKAGFCPTCRKRIVESDFRTEQDKKKYTISGMCQKCLDEVFDNDDD